MAKIIHFIRHAESQANVWGIYQGQSFDTGLTETGKAQAAAVAQLLKRTLAEVIYTSPLKRAKETAKIIALKTGLKIITDKRLLEINHGDWEGKIVAEFNQKERLRLSQWQKNPTRVNMSHGENLNQVIKRYQAFIRSLTEKEHLVVAHDLTIRVMITLAIRHQLKYLWQYVLDNGGITTISFNPNRLISLNQNWHLNGLRSKLNRQAL